MTATVFTSTTIVASEGATTSGRRRMWAVGAIAGLVSSLVVIVAPLIRSTGSIGGRSCQPIGGPLDQLADPPIS